LLGAEQVPPTHGLNDLAFYVRRWWPSKYEVGCLQEIYVTDLSIHTALSKVWFSLIQLLFDQFTFCPCYRVLDQSYWRYCVGKLGHVFMLKLSVYYSYCCQYYGNKKLNKLW